MSRGSTDFRVRGIIHQLRHSERSEESLFLFAFTPGWIPRFARKTSPHGTPRFGSIYEKSRPALQAIQGAQTGSPPVRVWKVLLSGSKAITRQPFPRGPVAERTPARETGQAGAMFSPGLS